MLFDTVIVGAGVSGLAAAARLHKVGQRVVVLEARERIGGRLHSLHADDRITDMGASWIHGITDSSVYELCQENGIATAEFTAGSYQPGGMPITYFGEDGEPLATAQAAEFTADFAALEPLLAREIAVSAPGETYAQVTQRAVARLGRETGLSALRQERLVLHHLHRAEEQYGVQAWELDAHGLDDDAIEGAEVVFPGGYAQLADVLAAGLDVRLGVRVEKICYGDALHGAVAGAGGSGARVLVRSTAGEFLARNCVVTVPVGVLAADDIAFVPELPRVNRDALAGLQMNAFEKIFLRFAEPFWDTSKYVFRRLGEPGRVWHSWYNLTALHGEPTLLTFAAGDLGKRVRNMSQDDVVAEVLSELRLLFGAAVTEPVDVQISAWQDDEFARGSYAYLKVGGYPAQHTELATPIADCLHIAGEATWQDDPATVTAALESGRRAADRILGLV